MTTDERLEKLLETVEALAATVKSLETSLRSTEMAVRSLDQAAWRYDEAFMEFRSDRHQGIRVLQDFTKAVSARDGEYQKRFETMAYESRKHEGRMEALMDRLERIFRELTKKPAAAAPKKRR
jgi:hypothetical protein